VTDRDPVLEALRLVRREDFLPPDQRGSAGADQALHIGHRQTNSQPTTVRNMLRLLEVQPGQRILDVGSGSGWTTALLGVLTGPSGKVWGVEIVPELAEWGRDNLSRYEMSWTSIRQARVGVLGLPEEAPFDRILVSAEARTLPVGLVDQLRPGGLIVVPVAGRMTRARRTEGEPEITHHGHYSFVPLLEPPEGRDRSTRHQR
jgi:protein-L-isoaspartate(D-aspartate) O-methyltransferase